jgi:hypothetical protein
MVVLGALLIAPECPRRACKTWSPDRASHRLPGRHGRRAGRKARFFDRSELRRLRFPKRRRSDSRAAPSKIIKLTGPAMVATVRDDAKSADRRFDPRDGPPGRVRLRLCGHADRRGRLLRDQLQPQHDADPSTVLQGFAPSGQCGGRLRRFDSAALARARHDLSSPDLGAAEHVSHGIIARVPRRAVERRSRSTLFAPDLISLTSVFRP